MGVPDQIDVEGGDCDVCFVRGEDLEEAGIFGKEAGYGGVEGGRVEPVYPMHLFDERSLTDDGADEVERGIGAVVPVMGHHTADSYLFEQLMATNWLPIVRPLNVDIIR